MDERELGSGCGRTVPCEVTVPESGRKPQWCSGRVLRDDDDRAGSALKHSSHRRGPDKVRARARVTGTQYDKSGVIGRRQDRRGRPPANRHDLLSGQADAVCGADYGTRAGEQVNRRNGYRHRRLDTRMGTMDVAIPKLREGTWATSSSSTSGS